MKNALDVRTNVCNVRTCNICSIRTSHVFRTNHIFIIRTNVSDVRINDICCIRTNNICVIRTNNICVIRTNNISIIRTNDISGIRTNDISGIRICIYNILRSVGQHHRLAFWNVKIKTSFKTIFFLFAIFWRLWFLVMLEPMQCQISIFNGTVKSRLMWSLLMLSAF